MTNTKNTKRALISSVVALFLCFAMLVGSTFAWFTDSVTSANNIIKSGNLDISLEHADTILGVDDAGWVDASVGAIFNYDKWEPGYTVIKYVKIENEGTLDLKFILNIIPNNAAEEVNLADVIEVYMVSGAVAVDRNALTTDSDAYVGTLTSLMNENDGAAHGVLYAKDNADAANGKNYNEIYTIALKMSTSASNEYMGKSVGGGFAVQLLATQLASEEDAFGNDYDAGATFPEVSLGNAQKNEGETADVAADDVTVNVPAGAPAGNYTVEVTDKTVTTDAQGNTTAAMDINLKRDGAKVTADGTKYNVSVEIGAGLTLTKVTHNGVELTDYDYDVVSGVITFETEHFSPFTFTYVPFTADEMQAFSDAVAQAQAGDTVTLNLTKDAYWGEGKIIVAPKGVNLVVNGNGHTIFADNAITVFGAKQDSNMTINDLTIVGTTTDDCIISQNNGVGSTKIVLNNVTVNLTKVSGNNWPVCIGGMGDVEMTDCVITGAGLASGDYADGNVLFMGGERHLTLKNCQIDNVMLNNNNSTMYVDADSTVGYVYLEAKNLAAVTGSVENVGEMYFAVGTADELVAALEAGADVIFKNDIKIDPANMSNAYGTTGINVKNGQTINGDGHTLNIKGAGGTWDSGINTTGGVIKNITVTGSFRGIFVNHTSKYSETVVLENVILTGVTYTVSCDQGMNQNLVATNCTFNGWTSFAGTLGTAKFVNCTFAKGNGYNFSRPYAPTTYIDCTFAEGHLMDPHAAVTLNGCNLNGVKITAENVANLVYQNTDKATVK